MRTIRRRVAVFACAMAVGLAAADLRAAQPTERSAAHLVPVSIAIGGSAAQEPEGEGFHFSRHRPVLRVGQDYTLRAHDAVGKVHSFFGDVVIEGHAEDEVVVVLGNVRVKSTAIVDSGLVVLGGSLTIDPGAKVGDDLVLVGGTLTAPPDFSPGGQQVVIGSPTLGNTLRATVPWITRGLLVGRPIVPDLGWMWLLAGLVFLVYLAVNTLFDRPVRICADAIVRRPLSTFLLGLLVLVLTAPALALLAATVVGIAVVPFVLCAMIGAALVGKAGVARAIGRKVVEQSEPESKLQALRSFVVGSILITLAYMVPVLGLVVWALTSVAAVGSAAIALRATLRREHPPRDRAAQPTGDAPLPAQPAEESAAVPGASPDPQLFPRATFLDRVAAFAVDCFMIAIAVQVFDFSRHGSFPLLLFAYHVAFWAWKGTTLGGIVVGLRVVRVPMTEMRFADALVRGLAGILSLGALGIGCLWMLQDPERQMWHDKIAGTAVVKVPRALAMA